MFVDANKAVVRRFYDELWNGRQLDVADEIFAEGCRSHQLRSGEESSALARAPEEIKQHVREWLAGFPDLRFEVDELIAEGDLVASRCSMSGSHQGSWMGLEPNGKQINIVMSVTHRIREGLIVEDWVIVEALGFFQQLGLIPPTETLFVSAVPTKDR